MVVAARRTERLDDLVRDITASGGRALAIPTDMRREEEILRLFEQVRATWGGTDILINNAGLGHLAPLVDGDTDHWREMLEVNVLGLCIATREAVRDMRARNAAGHVVHVSSMAAHRVPPNSGVYSATKFAVRSLTESLRQELRALRSPIRVTSVSPGFVETEFAAHYHDSEEKARETYSQFQVLQPEEVASAVLYAVTRPAHVQIHDLLMRPTDQGS